MKQPEVRRWDDPQAMDEFEAAQRKALQADGLTEEEVQRAMEPILSFHAGIREEQAQS